MAICPVANKVGCEECMVVKVCVLRTVLGNYGEEEKVDTEAKTMKVDEIPPPPQ